MEWGLPQANTWLLQVETPGDGGSTSVLAAWQPWGFAAKVKSHAAAKLHMCKQAGAKPSPLDVSLHFLVLPWTAECGVGDRKT